MISRYQVSLNDVSLNEINENLLVLDVNYAEPIYQVDSTSTAQGNGEHIIREHKQNASVTITFELHLYSITERQAVCQQVNAWARNGGILRINDREDQRLSCRLSRPASVASARNWTDPISITFSAHMVPFWEEEEPAVITLSGRSTSGALEVPGNGGDALVSVTITAKAVLTSIRVNAGSTYIELTDISVPKDGTVSIGYQDGLLYIRQGNTSLLAKRTAASSDNLEVPSGKTSSVSIVASANVAATFSARGCWE